MNLIMGHQKRISVNGRLVSIAEDGAPYAQDGIIVVADGLGGRGGFQHTIIKPEVLNKDNFFDVAFGNIFNKADDDFKGYVLNSFSQLFELSDCYFEKGNARTSGYFASRLVSAIVVYQFRFEEEFDRRKIFEKLSSINEVEKDKYVKSLVDKLCDKIKQNLNTIVDNMGLKLESKITGSYMLPTTMTIALTNELENEVEVLYIWAGDSRGYVWDKGGLSQVTDDHEKNETMTNLITMSRSFTFESRLVKFAKPVVIFNVTDGCYKCTCFASPLDLEQVLLTALEESSDFEGASRYLDELYDGIGKVDDSNTMGMLTFGYEDYQALKADVLQRKETINNEIVAKMPEIFTRDYIEELEVLERKTKSVILETKDDLIKNQEVIDLVKKRLEQSAYMPYIKEKNSINFALNELEESDQQQRKAVQDYVKEHWIKYPRLKKYSDKKKKPFGRTDPYETAQGYESKIEMAKSRQRMEVADSIDRLSLDFDSLLSMKETIVNLDSIMQRENLDRLTKKIRDLRSQLDQIASATNNNVKEQNDATEDLDRINGIYVEEDTEAIDMIATDILQGKFLNKDKTTGDAMKEAVVTKLKKDLQSYIDKIKANENERNVFLEQKATLLDKYMQQYWNANANSIIDELINNNAEFATQQLKGEGENDTLASLEQKKKEIMGYIEQRQRIYDEYWQKTFIRYFKESTL